MNLKNLRYLIFFNRKISVHFSSLPQTLIRPILFTESSLLVLLAFLVLTLVLLVLLILTGY